MENLFKKKACKILKKEKNTVCIVCGLSESDDLPMQNAHVIGLDMGIIDLGLTPDFLDSDSNIVTAHRGVCNQDCELNLYDAMVKLKSLGLSIPQYLPDEIQRLWRNV